MSGREDVLELSELRRKAVDVGKQAAFAHWQAKNQRVSYAALGHVAANATANALVKEVRELRGAVRRARDEMAALVPKPRAVDLDDWPCENEADRECLQAAWGELNRALPHTQEARDGR